MTAGSAIGIFERGAGKAGSNLRSIRHGGLAIVTLPLAAPVVLQEEHLVCDSVGFAVQVCQNIVCNRARFCVFVCHKHDHEQDDLVCAVVGRKLLDQSG